MSAPDVTWIDARYVPTYRRVVRCARALVAVDCRGELAPAGLRSSGHELELTAYHLAPGPFETTPSRRAPDDPVVIGWDIYGGPALLTRVAAGPSEDFEAAKRDAEAALGRLLAARRAAAATAAMGGLDNGQETRGASRR